MDPRRAACGAGRRATWRPTVPALWESCGWGGRSGADSLVDMTNTTNATLTDVHDMIVVHRAFRREFTLISPLVRGVAAGDTARAAVVTKHAQRLQLYGKRFIQGAT